MTMRSELKKILDIVADLADNDVKKDVLETKSSVLLCTTIC